MNAFSSSISFFLFTKDICVAFSHNLLIRSSCQESDLKSVLKYMYDAQETPFETLVVDMKSNVVASAVLLHQEIFNKLVMA